MRRICGMGFAVLSDMENKNGTFLNTNFFLAVDTVFEKGWFGEDNISLAEIGKTSPECCRSFPETNGFYLCGCGRHIVQRADDRASDFNLIRIFKLPPTEAKFIKLLLKFFSTKKSKVLFALPE